MRVTALGATPVADVRRPQRDEARLALLLSDIGRARSAFEVERDQPAGSTHRDRTSRLAGRLAQAMQLYADAAASAGAPLPYRYRDQMRLYRALAGDDAVSQGRGR